MNSQRFPVSCPQCDGQNVATGLEVRFSGETGRVGFKFHGDGLLGAVFVNTEALLADVCSDCGTVTRMYVENPERAWVSR